MSHKSELTKIFRKNFEGIEEEEEAIYITELLDYINKLVKSTSSVVKATSAEKKVSKSSDSKSVRPYAQFVKFCSHYSKNNTVLDILVTPGDYYKKKDTKSYKFFEENLKDDVGVETTFNDIFQRVRALVEPGGGAMRTAGVCWGLLNSDSQEELLATMD